MTKRMALLIGIDDYSSQSRLSPLRFAEADVDLMSEVLQSKAGFITRTLKGQDATHDRVLRTLREFYEEEDLASFVFYFAGHGEMMLEVGRFCLHCFGSEAEDTMGTIALSEVAQRIRNKIPAQSAALIVDACRSGMYRSSCRGGAGALSYSVVSELKAISDEVPRVWEEPPLTYPRDQYLVTFLSCGPGQVSYEDSELGHGIFTYGLVQELRGCKATAPLEALRKRIGDFTRARCKQKRLLPVQTPEWIEPSFSGEFFLGPEPSEVVCPVMPPPNGERRAMRRFEMALPVRARLAHALENVIVGKTGDISAHGLSMFSEFPISVGHDIAFEITVPTGLPSNEQTVVSTQGEIVRVEMGRESGNRGWKLAATIRRYKFTDSPGASTETHT